MSDIQFITTDKAPIPLGHYSQATVYNGTVYVAGQLGIYPNDPKHVGSIEEQTEQALTNVREILVTAGSDLNKLLKVTIFISDIAYWAPVNAVYIKMLKDHKPARAIVPVNELPQGFHIEIDAIAAV